MSRHRTLLAALLLVVGMALAPTRAAAAPWGNADAQAAYDAGVAALRAGDADAAARSFRAALDLGAIDPRVYHGLGNALYRDGELGLAIGAWQRSLALDPGDADVIANLQRARRDTRDRLDAPAPTVGPFFWQAAVGTGTTALASGVLGAVALCALIPVVMRRSKPAGRAVGVRVAMLSGAASLVLAASTALAARQPAVAVVTVPEVAARSALGPSGIDLFVLHEGAEVSVDERATQDGASYVLVVLPDARKGWLPAAALVLALPDTPFPPA